MLRSETLAFLSCVLPSEGFYCAVIFNTAHPRPGIDFPRQQICASLDELTDVLLANDKAGRTVYHACAAFRDPKGIFNEQKQKWETRTQQNARGASAFWFDLDIKPGKYPDKPSAAESAVAFADWAGIPRPVLVDSGNGVHCYWPLERELDPGTWQRYAEALKARSIEFGLKADHGLTGNIACILRPPGTYNRKEGEKLVQVDARHLDRTPIDRFAGLLGSVPARPARAVARGTDSIVGRIGAGGTYGAVYADAVADQCAQLDALRVSGNILEPHWYACLGVLSRCEDGELKAHEWSARDYPGYSAVATTHKLDRARALTGATTCTKFDDVNPGTCGQCPLQGRINSPISISPTGADKPLRTRVRPGEITNPEVGGFETADGEFALPPAPAPYSWSPSGQLRWTTEDGNGLQEHVVLCHHPVYLQGVQTGELDNGSFSYRFKKFLPKEGWSDVLIDAKLLHGNGGIADMFGKGVVVHDAKHFLNYARLAVDAYHAEEQTQVRYDQFGWKNDDQSFLYGKMLYTGIGPVEAIGAKEVVALSQWLGPKKGGNVQAWTDAADSLFASGMEAASAVVLASFAAPLMRFQSSEEGGAIIHLFTPSSGMGKTTALMGAWTVWGAKEGLSLTNDDTRVSKPIAIGTLANLPVIYDELRDKDPEVIRRMVVMFTEGRDRKRGMVDGTLRHTKANWQTILLSAANNSLIDVLQSDGVDAPAFRVLELSTELSPKIDKAKGDRLKRVLNDNAGHAGDAYLRYLCNPAVLAWTRQALTQWTDEIWQSTGADSAQRFRVRAIGAIAVASALVNKLGILHFQTDRIVRWLMEQTLQARHLGTVSAMTSLDGAIGAFGEFINQHYGETLVVADRFKPRAAKMIPLLKPHNRLSIRYEIATSRVFISETVFRDWAISKQHSPRMLMDILVENRVLLGKRSVTLSAGTDIPGAQVACIEANAAHPVMSGMLASIAELDLPHRNDNEATGH